MAPKYIEAVCVKWQEMRPDRASPDGYSFHLTNRPVDKIVAYLDTKKWGILEYGVLPEGKTPQTAESRLVRLPVTSMVAQELTHHRDVRITPNHILKNPKLRRAIEQLHFSRARITICYRHPMTPDETAARQQSFSVQLALARQSLRNTSALK